MVYLLLKYFNFQVSHSYYIPENFDINNIIKLSSNKFKYNNYILIKLDNNFKANQCIYLFNFPPNFS